MKKVLSLLIVFLMISSVLVSCANETDTGDLSDTNKDGEDITETIVEVTETDRSQTKDSLPETLDFGGESVKILARDDGFRLSLDIFAPEDTGDVVETAIYKRNLAIEERLNVKLEPIFLEQDIHGGDKLITAIRKSVQAGSDEYDIVANHMSHSTTAIVENMYVNLLDLDYLDFEQPWWAKNFMDEITINGQCYMMAGEASITMIQSMYLLFYNKDIYKNYFADDINDIVLDGKWTLDKLTEFSKATYLDLNGDGLNDEGDQYGYSTTTIRLIDALLGGSNIPLSVMGSDGYPEFAIEENPRVYEFVEKAHTLVKDKTITWEVERSATGETHMLNKFASGSVLFIPYTPMGADHLREMSDDFGVIPIPKLNDDQEKYTTYVHNGFSAFAIVQTSQNPNMAAAVCEAMGAENYRNVTTAYYEVALKVKYSRDDISSQMLDMIRDSIRFDFAYINDGTLNEPMGQFRQFVIDGPGNTASAIAKNMPNCQTKLESLLEKYMAME